MIAFALSLLLVLAIALAQRWAWAAGFDHDIMRAAGKLREGAIGRVVTPIMIAASAMGSTGARLALLAVAVGWLSWRRRSRTALWLAVTVIGGMLFNMLLKQMFGAPRPGLLPHLDIVTSYSFPSGHAAGGAVLLGALAWIAGRRFWLPAAILVALVGASRVWLGVHWPSDVAAGWIAGLGWLALCGAFLRR